MRITASARVTVLLEIPASSTWGPLCSMEQLRKQAITDAIGTIKKMSSLAEVEVKVIGTPKVSAVVIDMDEKP